jgi:hypothetical protein
VRSVAIELADVVADHVVGRVVEATVEIIEILDEARRIADVDAIVEDRVGVERRIGHVGIESVHPACVLVDAVEDIDAALHVVEGPQHIVAHSNSPFVMVLAKR